MKPLVFALLMLAGFNGVAQTDSLLFHSFERIIKHDGGVGYKDEIFVAINKYDLETLKLKDTTVINVVGREFKIIILKNPAEKKDFYVLPIGYKTSNYIVFNIQNCNRRIDKTFTISYAKKPDNLFEIDDFEVTEAAGKSITAE